MGNVMLGIALQDFGNLSLKVGGVGNQGETVEQISEAIVSDVREVLHNHPAEKTTVSGQSYEISHDPAGGPGHFSYSYGSYSYEGDLVHIVIRELKGKEKQLSDVRQHQGLRAVALDLRSLFPNLPPPDKYEAIAPGWLKYYRPRIRRWRTRVIWDVQQYLRSSNSIDAALIWWKHGRAAGLSTIKERFEYRFSVDVISGDHYWNASNCRELKTVLETAYSQRGCKKCLGVSMLRSLFERPTSWR